MLSFLVAPAAILVLLLLVDVTHLNSFPSHYNNMSDMPSSKRKALFWLLGARLHSMVAYALGRTLHWWELVVKASFRSPQCERDRWRQAWGTAEWP